MATSLMNFFRPAAPVQQNQQQQPANNQQQNNQQQQNPAGKANEPGNNGGGNQGNPDPNAGTNKPADPWSNYSKMFDNSTTEADTPPAFNIDPKTLSDVASQQDFMKGLDPELMQRATSGDMSAMMEIMHNVSRNAYRTSIEHSGLLTDKFVGAREAHSAKGLGSRVKQELTDSHLANTPNFKHPVVRQQLKEVATRLQRQHPDASAEEIAQMSRDYITQLAEAMNPDGNKQAPGKGKEPNVEERGEEYWDNYFGDASK